VNQARRGQRGRSHYSTRHRVPAWAVDSGQRGSASLWLLTLGLVLVAAGLAGAMIGAARLARQAAVAADLAALAGAARVFDGPGPACERAAELAARNGGRLAGCVVEGLQVAVTVEVVVLPFVGVDRPAVAHARAGPVLGPPATASDPG
jgi:secretion/DNA translocation related TadE-like protein